MNRTELRRQRRLRRHNCWGRIRTAPGKPLQSKPQMALRPCTAQEWFAQGATLGQHEPQLLANLKSSAPQWDAAAEGLSLTLKEVQVHGRATPTAGSGRPARQAKIMAA